MEGFEKEGEHAFPDMQLLIVSDQGDTALHLNDLYADYKERFLLYRRMDSRRGSIFPPWSCTPR